LKKAESAPIIGYYGIWVALTYLSIVFAVLGMFHALRGNIGAAIILLLFCGLCDMFDGPVARMTNRTKDQESFGIQVDSLADLVSFGVFPAVIGFSAGAYSLIPSNPGLSMILSIAATAAYVLAAQIRLAYFNVEEAKLQNNQKQRTHYEGLPVTFAAILIPFVYAVCILADFDFNIIYAPMLFVTAIAFISRSIKIPKIRGWYLLIFLFIGIPLAFFLLWHVLN